MGIFSLHIGHKTTGTMAYDYDYDHFRQELKPQHLCERGHSHGQWSWSISPEVKRYYSLILNRY